MLCLRLIIIVSNLQLPGTEGRVVYSFGKYFKFFMRLAKNDSQDVHLLARRLVML